MIKETDLITSDGILEFCTKNNICYIKTDFFYIGQFTWRGQQHPRFLSDVCVVGHSDYPINDEISKNFKKIFCVNNISDNQNTYGIPLGLTNDCDDSPIHPIYGNKKILIDTINKNLERNNLVYMNFNINNYPTERSLVWNYFSGFDWVKIGTIDNTISGRVKFLEEIKSSKFTLCPRGNGIDTHRMWESLYLGSIPIVRYENAHKLFLDLPILFIDDWSQIDKEFLETKYKEIKSKNWNLEKLKISYWTEFIKNTIKK